MGKIKCTNYKVGNNCLASCTAEKDLGDIMDHTWNMSQQCEAVATSVNILVYINRYVMGRPQEVVLLLHATLVRPQLDYCVQLWAPQFMKCEQIGENPEESNRNDKRLRKPDL